MNQIVFLLKKYAKAVAAFVAAVVLQMITDLINGTAPWPQSSGEWVRYAVVSIGAAITVYGVPNLQDKVQVTKSLKKLPDAEAEQAVNTAYPTWNIDAA